MGLPAQSVALFLAEHLREPFTGPVLSYGEQLMNIPYGATLWIFERLGLTPHPDGMADLPETNDPDRVCTAGQADGFGAGRTLDVSAYEGADIVADLNQPVPPELQGQFGAILDGGTMEHVFDIRQGMKNTADLLRPGGRVVHITPVNNYVNHGFVQVSPTLYHDYYIANGFDDVRGIMIVHPRDAVFLTSWNYFDYRHDVMGGVNSMFCSAETQLAVYFTAKKTAASTSDRVPMQSFFTHAHEGREAPAHQYNITHNPNGPAVRLITEPPTEGSVRIEDIVRFG